jgi:hypothetical protein
MWWGLEVKLPPRSLSEHAKLLGQPSEGGKARAASQTPAQRKKSALHAINTRWKKHKKDTKHGN